MRAKTLYSSIANKPKFAGVLFIVLTSIITLMVYLFTPRIPQWESYHQFADVRQIWGIPHFWNVVSNIPFLLVSILGFISLQKQWKNNNLTAKEAIVFFILFFGVFLIGIGSSYYHWAPDNDRLVWDRIPITIVFMSLLSLTVMERINSNLGFRLLTPFIALGIFSVLYWYWTELSGQGDLRLYGLVQFYSIFLIVFILFFFPCSYPPLKSYVWMIVFYGVAKIFEHYDPMIYGLISGHTLKHLCAAISTYFIVIMLNAHPTVQSTGLRK
ncbi:ceramidase domain-containing protein [Legionella maioricensis]|uniref:Ceramidase n=1 Tax=Legionella maioricensis TaxID=2896528 RepID=A0A9X2IAL9_9GAMM|nr:ceramidase domain-containing protein [Legionella maioricensis]MCL9682657.1 ceramidase [Legionella maioricensis]MCL9687296.1 ceramidase [Legionella maioricensis]